MPSLMFEGAMWSQPKKPSSLTRTLAAGEFSGIPPKFMSLTQRAKIIAALKEADAPMTTTALMEATEMKRNSLDLALSRMSKAGDIKRIKTGLYAHKDYTPAPPDKPKRSVSSVSGRQITGQIKEASQAH